MTVRAGDAVRRHARTLATAARNLSRHRASTLAAALAFRALLALAPLLVIAVALLSHVLGAGSARAEALIATREALGPRAAALAADWIDSARRAGVAASAIGAALFLYGAARLLTQVDVALDVIFSSDALPCAPPPRRRLRVVVRERLLGILLTIGAGAWIAAALAARTALVALWPRTIHGLRGGELLLSWLSLALGLAVVYKVLPPRRLRWPQVLGGAALTAVLFVIAARLLELWFTRFQVAIGYASAGGVIVVLMFLYALSLCFLLGAEMTAVVASASPRRLSSARAADPVRRSG